MSRATEKYGCAVRELEMRKRAYPRWVTQGRMTQAEADREIALMDEIARDYLALANSEPAGPLFGDG